MNGIAVAQQTFRTARAVAVGALACALQVMGCDSGRVASTDAGGISDAAAAEANVDVVDLSDASSEGVGGDAPKGDVDGPPGVVRVTLTGEIFTGQGYDLDANLTVADGKNDASADFYLSLAMIISLAGNHSFCEKGDGFASVLDVPVNTTGCSWGVADLGGNTAPRPPSMFSGAGFLVRNRDGEVDARIMIVSDSIGPDGHTEVTFDIERIIPALPSVHGTIVDVSATHRDGRARQGRRLTERSIPSNDRRGNGCLNVLSSRRGRR